MSVKDVLKKSFVEAEVFNRALTLETIVSFIVALAVSLLVGLFIYSIYKKYYLGVVFSQSFAITLVGMCVLSTTITLAISTNIVISLGMVGALSIVRYRTAVKEPLDLLYLFWAITAGITIGAFMYILIILASAIMLVLILLMSKKQSEGQVRIMIVHYTGDSVSDEIQKALHPIKFNIKSQTVRENDCELTIEVHMKHENPLVIEKIKSIENVHDVTLLQYNGVYYG